MQINTKHVKTEVLVENGGTVVIGGIYEQDDRTDITKVPFLGDLPLIGWLFKNTTTSSAQDGAARLHYAARGQRTPDDSLRAAALASSQYDGRDLPAVFVSTMPYEARGNLYLVGMMGAGKTTVGRLLARRLKLRFLRRRPRDRARCGVKIPVIFEIEGESGFRARETQAIAELTSLDGIVLATGGGAVSQGESRAARGARHRGLPARDAGGSYERVRQDRNRPLLAADDPLGRLRELYRERDPLYREVADVVDRYRTAERPGTGARLLEQLGELWKASA